MDESGDGPRGIPSRDMDTSADSTLSKDSDSSHSNQHHYHHSSNRERASTSLSTHAMGEKTSAKHNSTIQGALMHLIKTGDLDALKQLVREGANVNEQDEHGWTALHEFSSRNLSRLVAYLLRHGARPELVDRNGDTALHAAARANHGRVVRTLLRHSADPMLKNARGERPLDLCPDTESGVILSQHMELLHGHSNHSVGKYSSASSGRMQRHHHSAHGPHSSTVSSHGIRHSSASAILSSDPLGGGLGGSVSRGSADGNSDSDDACSTPGVGTSNITASVSVIGAVNTDLITIPSGRSTSSPSGGNQRVPYGMESGPKPNRATGLNPSPTQHLQSSQSTSSEPSHDPGPTASSGPSSNPNMAASAVSGTVADETELASQLGDGVTEDGGASQKVPPLRIKFASGASTETEPGSQTTPTAAVNSNCNEDNALSLSDASKGTGETTAETRDVRKETNTASGPAGDSGCGNLSLEPSSGGCGVGNHTHHSDSSVTSRESIEGNKHKSADNSHTDLHHRVGSEHTSIASVGAEADADETRHSANSAQLCEDTSTIGSSHARPDSENTHETGRDAPSKDTHRHRSGRTLRSHTAAQREREEKERHNDTTPIKKRKLRSRTDGHPETCSNRTESNASWTPSSGNTYSTTGTTARSHGTDDPASHDSGDVIHAMAGQDSSTAIVKEDGSVCSEVRAPKSDALKDEVDEEMDDVTQTTGAGTPDPDRKIKVESEPEQKIDNSDSPTVTTAGKSSCATTSGAPGSTASCSVKSESPDAVGEGISYLRCPAGPDDSKQHPELLMFENPFEKSAAIQRKLRELVNNLVEVHPKSPCGYSDYLLVTRNYLLASQTPTLIKKSPPAHLKPVFVELFNEQEEERYAQALKHQSEREDLRLCAEQAVLRAQTRAALAVANLSKPLSFCSVLAYKNLTYVPPSSKTEQRDEENVRDRFTSRTFFGWLEDIKDTFQQEKKKLLCRQLHEAESLMMVQRLDWESKLKESQLHDYGTDVLKEIPHHHVPLIHVPNDFPLFAHDPVHRTALV
ncbi:unnamed protein product [Echinostoma caproni]|uniref:Uncharacterized protein n=1 Tax=Echinostoma caproni TaxID=27848 RepID=A0A3P8F3W8_9TREM|nr:unnamed protein product [Echinostoma caproni]